MAQISAAYIAYVGPYTTFGNYSMPVKKTHDCLWTAQKRQCMGKRL